MSAAVSHSTVTPWTRVTRKQLPLLHMQYSRTAAFRRPKGHDSQGTDQRGKMVYAVRPPRMKVSKGYTNFRDFSGKQGSDALPL